jgi:hypothetical protein
MHKGTGTAARKRLPAMAIVLGGCSSATRCQPSPTSVVASREIDVRDVSRRQLARSPITQRVDSLSDPSATLRGTSGGGLLCDHTVQTVQTVLSARQRDGMIHVLVVVPRARAHAVRASSLAPAGEPMHEA